MFRKMDSKAWFARLGSIEIFSLLTVLLLGGCVSAPQPPAPEFTLEAPAFRLEHVMKLPVDARRFLELEEKPWPELKFESAQADLNGDGIPDLILNSLHGKKEDGVYIILLSRGKHLRKVAEIPWKIQLLRMGGRTLIFSSGNISEHGEPDLPGSAETICRLYDFSKGIPPNYRELILPRYAADPQEAARILLNSPGLEVFQGAKYFSDGSVSGLGMDLNGDGIMERFELSPVYDDDGGKEDEGFRILTRRTKDSPEQEIGHFQFNSVEFLPARRRGDWAVMLIRCAGLKQSRLAELCRFRGKSYQEDRIYITLPAQPRNGKTPVSLKDSRFEELLEFIREKVRSEESGKE